MLIKESIQEKLTAVAAQMNEPKNEILTIYLLEFSFVIRTFLLKS